MGTALHLDGTAHFGALDFFECTTGGGDRPPLDGTDASGLEMSAANDVITFIVRIR